MNDRLKQAWDSRVAFWIAAIFIVAIVIAAIVIVVGGNDDTGPDTKPSPSASPSASGDPSAPATPGEGAFVTLPAPAQNTGGYPTHYAQTAEGAAATALAFFISSGSVLDYERGPEIAKAYITGLQLSEAEAGDSMVSTLRKDLGLGLNGAAPPGVAVSYVIDGVKWTQDGEDYVVSAEFTRTFTAADGAKTTTTGAVSIGTVVWSGGRWWIDGSAQTAGAPESYVEPGTTAYAAAGWNVLRSNEWTGGLL